MMIGDIFERPITDELLGHFKKFFFFFSNSIENPTNDIGVWISGFYGSGKSHFLKILSYLLMNKEINGKKPIDYFIGDKVTDDSLIENMRKVLNVKNDVVLFNVASKASPKDTIIDVLFKVFNDLRGYSNKFLNIEKALDEEGKFDEFKRLFEKYEGKSWESKRQDLVRFKNLKRSLIEVGFTSDEEFNLLLSKKDYDFTPENLAKEVNEYCVKNNTHVLFFIDEIGQFISEYSDLMLELQSIVEELAKECYGKSWVIVTSQDTLLDMTNDKENDFSKIQARFDTRLPLSASRVDEIIKIRLLEKNDESKNRLESDYEKYGSSLKNVLTFVDSSEMKNYSSLDEYIDNYPIIPYQFKLLQESLIQLRENSASGAGVGAGARSMIQIIHETIKDNEVSSTETLFPFYMFYNHIRGFINQEHVRVINNARDNDNLNDFDVNVLKTLFLIKYISDSFLKPNLENIATLMISNVNDNKITLKEEISDSLKRLIKEVFVNQKDDCYYYLTTKQQEINKEIKAIFIDDNEKHKFLLTYIKDIVRESIPRKFKIKDNYEFSVNVNLDNLEEIDKDLGLSFLSSAYYDSGSLNEYYLKNISSNKNFAILRLSDDICLFDEINGILQIENYLDGKEIQKRESVECEKQEELNARKNKIKHIIEDYIVGSSIYIWGEKVIIRENNTKDLFNEILKKLFERVYYNFNLISFEAKKEDIFNALKLEDQKSLLESENQSNALLDLENFLRPYDGINIKDIYNRYENAPFGFNKFDISYLIAKLFAQKRISLILNDKEIFIENNYQKIYGYITMRNSVDANRLFISIREEIDSKMKNSVKNTYKEISDGQIIDDLEGLMSSFKLSVEKNIQEINNILDDIKREDKYPGKNVLSESKLFFEEILNKNTLIDFYKHIWENEKRFYEVLDDLITVTNFYQSVQIDIFKESLLKIDNYEFNGIYVQIDSINDIISKIRGIVENDSPYSDIQRLKQLNETYDNELNILLEAKKEPVLQKINEDIAYFEDLIEKSNLKSEDEEIFKENIPYKYNLIKEKIIETDLFSVIDGKKKEMYDVKETYIKSINYSINQNKESESSINLSDILIDGRSIRSDEEIQELLDLIESKIKNELKENDVVIVK